MTSPSCPNEACIQSIVSPAKVVLHGFFRVRCGRRRRYRCRGCGRTFSARTNTPYFGLGCSWPAFERVAHLSVEGTSCAAIARVEGIKTWRKARVTRVERRAVIGTIRRLEKALEESEDSWCANTAYIERLNLTIRQSVAYSRRRSPTHARCVRRLHLQLELARCHYNFIRRHTGLRFGRELRTPAMVGGLRDQVCSFRDVCAFA